MSSAMAELVLEDPDLQHEHVELGSDAEPVDPACLTPTRTDAVLVLGSAARQQRLEIFNGTCLRVVTASRRAGPRELRLDLAFLDPAPGQRSSPIWWRLGAFGGILAAAALGTIASGWPAGTTTVWLALAAATGMLVGAGGLLLHRGSRRMVFVTRHGRVPLVVLPSGSGNFDEARDFAARLRAAAAEAAGQRLGPRGHLLRDEMRAHRRLYEQGRISPEVFDAAKRRILAAHD